MTQNTNENLWETLLRESAKNSTSNNKFSSSSSVIILGDNNSSIRSYKSTLISLLSSSLSSSNSNINSLVNSNGSYEIHGNEIVTYQYLSVDDGSIVNLWSFDTGLWSIKGNSNDLDFMYYGTSNDQILFTILLDLTPSQGNDHINSSSSSSSSSGNNVNYNPIESLKRWLHFIKEKSSQLKEKYGIKYTQEKEQSIQSYLAGGINETVVEKIVNIYNFGFPIIVIGIVPFRSGESVSAEEFPELQRLKLLQGQIRKLSMDVGAAVLFSSMITSIPQDKTELATTTAINSVYSTKMKKYILHRLYPSTSLQSDFQIEDVNNTLFIPAGCDTNDLITVSTGYKSSSELSNIEIPNIHSESNEFVSTVISTQIEIESERDWLNNLQSFVHQVTALGSNPMVSLPTSGSSRKPIHAASEHDLSSLTNHDHLHPSSDVHIVGNSGNGTSGTATGGSLTSPSSDDSLSTKLSSKLTVDTAGTSSEPQSRSRTPVGSQSTTAASSKRATRTSLSGTENKQDVDDFFRNLLVNPASVKGKK